MPQQTGQLTLIEDDNVIETFAADRADDALDIGVLPCLAGRFVPGALGRRLRRGAPSVWVRAGRLMRGDPILWRKGFQAIKSGSSWDEPLRAKHNRAVSKYLPSRTKADLFCLLSEDNFPRIDRAPGPWRRLARSVRSEAIPGEHQTCITHYVGDLAECLDRILAT